MTVHFTVNKTLDKIDQRSQVQIFPWADFLNIQREKSFLMVGVKRYWVRIRPITTFYFALVKNIKDIKDRHKYPKVARMEKIM